MKHRRKWIALLRTLVVAVVFAVGAVAPTRANILVVNEVSDSGWENVITDPDSSDPPFYISGESTGNGSDASLNIEFLVDTEVNGAGPTEFLVEVTNLSDKAWESFVFGLGFIENGAFDFATGTSLELLFTGIESTTSTGFSMVVPNSTSHPHELTFSGGFVGVGGMTSFTFFITATGAVSPFTLQSYANAVPEPATLALFGLGLAGLGWSRRKMV